jgi:hypothetical protein
MTSPMTIVSFGRLVADRIRLEPVEACALVHQLWAQIARARGGEGSMAITLPGLNAVGITAFGDVEVRRPAAGRPDARTPHELAGDLGQLLLSLLHSGRATLASAGPACVAVARRATTHEPPVDGAPRLGSPSALLAELDRFRPRDPSSAIADVYARWMRTTDGGRLRPGGPQVT